MAGLSAAMHYLATAEESAVPALPDLETCNEKEAAALGASLGRTMARIRAYEMVLAARLLEAVLEVPGVSILGDADPSRVDARVPTVSFAVAGKTPATIVDRLAAHGIHAREGHMYAPRLLRAAGFDPDAGVARVSLCHYNTVSEIERFAQAIRVL